jgi:hypothetical protein
MAQFFMEKEFVDKLRNLVTTSQIEHCGNLVNYESSYYLIDDINKGTEHSCDFKEKKDEFFHTHPISAKSYPSYEDIQSVVKKRKMSIIATFWGIWFIYKNDRQVVCDDILFMFNSVYEHYNILFWKKVTHEKGSVPRSFQYNGDVKDLIDLFIKDMNKTLLAYCTIKFVAWDDIKFDDVQAYFSFRSKRGKKSKRKVLKKSVKKVKKSVRKVKKSLKKASKKSVKKVGKK